MSNIGAAQVEDAIRSLAWLLGTDLGPALFAVGMGLRLAWLPVSIWMMRRADRRRAVLAVLQPELDALARQHADDPLARLAATRALLDRHGVGGLDAAMLLPLVQLPVFGTAFAAVHRLAGTLPTLARPDLTLAGGTAALVGLSLLPNAQTPGQRAIAVVAVVFSFWLTHRFAAGVALYSAGAATVGVVQALWIRRLRTA